MKIFINTLKSLIAQNKIKLVMVVLTDFWHDKQSTAYNQCLLLRSNWLQAEQDYTTGLIDRNEVMRVMSRVKVGLIQLTDDVAGQSFEEEEAMKRATNIQNRFVEEEVPLPQRKRVAVWIRWLALPVVLAGGWWLAQDQFAVKTTAMTEPPEVRRTLRDTIEEVAALSRQADHLIGNNQEEQALALLSRAMSLQQLDYALYNQRADLYFKMGRYPQAENDAERAIRLNPNDCVSYVTIAQIMTKRGKTEAFYANMEKALQRNTANKCDLWQLDELPGIIEHRKEPRFQKLIAAYRH